MPRYRYRHKDGRIGQADSGWQAMLAAIGNEAHSLNLTKTVWHPERPYSQRGDHADVYADSEIIGRLENMG